MRPRTGEFTNDPQCTAAPCDADTGIILVDHGSRRPESNDLLLKVADAYARSSHFELIEPAHMELAAPSIADAFDKLVARGARRIVVMPYFLSPGKHWAQDIPDLTAEAASRHPDVPYLVTAPLGLHPLISQVIEARIDQCIEHAEGRASECTLCAGTDRCALRTAESSPAAG